MVSMPSLQTNNGKKLQKLFVFLPLAQILAFVFVYIIRNIWKCLNGSSSPRLLQSLPDHHPIPILVTFLKLLRRVLRHPHIPNACQSQSSHHILQHLLLPLLSPFPPQPFARLPLLSHALLLAHRRRNSNRKSNSLVRPPCMPRPPNVHRRWQPLPRARPPRRACRPRACRHLRRHRTGTSPERARTVLEVRLYHVEVGKR